MGELCIVMFRQDALSQSNARAAGENPLTVRAGSYAMTRRMPEAAFRVSTRTVHRPLVCGERGRGDGLP